MIKIKTKHFGEVELGKEKIIRFEEGIFGFEGEKEFALLYDNETDSNPFCWLQSVANRDVCLPMINPLDWYESYTPEIDDQMILKIGELDQQLLDIFTVIVIPNDIEKMTTNLKAPILINIKSHQGIQVIVNDDQYMVRHNFYEQVQKLAQEGEEK